MSASKEERHLSFTTETNALDYLQRAAQFIGETTWRMIYTLLIRSNPRLKTDVGNARLEGSPFSPRLAS
jgi:hypothetical protein